MKVDAHSISNIKSKILIGVLILVAIMVPYLMVSVSIMVAPVIIFLIITIPIVLLTFRNYGFGIFILFIYGSFLFTLYRLIPGDFPYGTAFDVLIVLIFLSMVIYFKGREKFQWKFNEPITITQLIFYGYFIFQIANPNAVSVGAWLASARFLALLLLFFVFLHFFDKIKNIKHFNTLWMVLAMLIALYGIQQEYFGLRDFEWEWIYDSPNRYALYFIWGNMRKFSFLSDPSAFGLFLAFSGTSCLMMVFGPFSNGKRAGFLLMALVSFFSMSFAGTRTAYAVIIVSVFLFILLNLRNVKVIVVNLALVTIFIVLMVGPFYGGPLNRMRSTLNFTEDASMAVRDAKRIQFQAYIQSNPIGGGVNTAGNAGLRYSSGHLLAGQYDPDSGYLRTALEMGVVGLLLFLILNASVAITGILNHFRLKDPLLKTYNMAFMIPFFGLSVAHYTQDALLQKPILIPVIATYALMIKLKDLDVTYSKNDT